MNNTFSPSKTKKELGISYLGGCNSPKLEKSLKQNVMTYGVYFAPHTVSGYNVCPQSSNCCKYCLHGSGRNKLELLSHKEGGPITKSRIKKTKLFFEDKETFMQLLIHEIIQAKKKAEAAGMKFAIRLNCTSDIDLEQFTLGGKNILQLFPDTQFYNYTKVLEHIRLSEKYGNYDITYSFSGENWDECEVLLKKGYRVAVVFEDILPAEFRGYPVIDANEYNARFLDDGGIICGLTYKRGANDYATGKYQRPDTTFFNLINESA